MTYVKGFFALDFGKAAIDGFLSRVPLVNSYITGWVAGEVRDSSTTAGKGALRKVSKQRYEQVKKLLLGFRPNLYHIFKFNCQEWAGFVLQ